MFDYIKNINTGIIGVSRKEMIKREGSQNVFDKLVAENFPNLKTETDIQIQEAQRVPNKINPNRPMPRHILIKMAKAKERFLKTERKTNSQL